VNDLWLPRSSCTFDCLPVPARRDLQNALLAVWRFTATVAVMLVVALALPLLATLPRRRLVAAQRTIARATLKALGVRHGASGRLPSHHALLVANHVSWLDVLVILAHTPARMLAKREVRDWPLIGRLGATLGTVFVDRTKPKTLPATVAEVAGNLAAGGVVAVFPEGTTWCGRTGGRFRPAMFQAAIDAGVRVVPVRLTFSVGSAPSTAAAFLGDESLLASVRRVVGTRGLTVGLRAHPALHPSPWAPRRTFARAAAAVISPRWTVEPINPELMVDRVPIAAPALAPMPEVGFPLAA
jgi:1-acyl-sn-glycerol-3-phosphate acyltransferase